MYDIKQFKASIDKSKLKLANLLQEGLDNEIINKEHFTAIDPKAKLAAKFYMTFKIHKEHAHGKTPPERPICSGSGTMLENACKFVEHYINKPAAQAAGADPSRCNTTNRQNPPLQ